MRFHKIVFLLAIVCVIGFISCSKSGGTAYYNIKYTLVTDHYEYIDSISFTDANGQPTNGFTTGPSGSYTWIKELQITQLPFTANIGAKAVSNSSTTSDFTLNIYVNDVLQDSQEFHVTSFSTEIGAIAVSVQ